jgi:hypothetical protein
LPGSHSNTLLYIRNSACRPASVRTVPRHCSTPLAAPVQRPSTRDTRGSSSTSTASATNSGCSVVESVWGEEIGIVLERRRAAWRRCVLSHLVCRLCANSAKQGQSGRIWSKQRMRVSAWNPERKALSGSQTIWLEHRLSAFQGVGHPARVPPRISTALIALVRIPIVFSGRSKRALALLLEWHRCPGQRHF